MAESHYPVNIKIVCVRVVDDPAQRRAAVKYGAGAADTCPMRYWTFATAKPISMKGRNRSENSCLRPLTQPPPCRYMSVGPVRASSGAEMSLQS